ncbi:MAG: hypothetical protein IAA16_03635 [Candidatus Treponema excrementipullorum]|uniref:Lipoprotein n=1 Tax=Candidatus Treponema excrementipullorum TaxID=2838768 RepID=A0A9E2L1Z6_9SPIR|nr:hypothetical protein [Candidatus Treponema excrementipullorum]
MSKKGLFTGLLALLLVFALLGCEQVTSGGGVGSGADPNDKWTEVTSLDGLDGTWKSSVTANMDGGVATLVMTITYPASGKDEVTEQEIKDGVKTELQVDEVPPTTTYVSKDDFERMLKNGEVPVLGIPDLGNGIVYLNSNKTKLKVVSSPQEVTKGPDDMPITDENWTDFQELSKSLYKGDMELVFSNGAPYMITMTQVFHKQ